jgi:hypothetical protein
VLVPEPTVIVIQAPVQQSVGCVCKPDYDPCCTTDNETYNNKCEAECE